MNKTIKILSIILITIMILTIQTSVFAMLSPNDISPTYNNTAAEGLKSIAGNIVGLIRNIAVIAGVILLSVIGVKFMLGSAEEKAEYKKSLMPLVVGIVVVMSATQIMTMIFGFLTPTTLN